MKLVKVQLPSREQVEASMREDEKMLLELGALKGEIEYLDDGKAEPELQKLIDAHKARLRQERAQAPDDGPSVD